MELSFDHADVEPFPVAVTHSAWPAGAARNNEGIALSVAPTATAHNVVMTDRVTADLGEPWEFAVDIPIALRPPEFVQLISAGGAAYACVADPEPGGDGDHVAEPGEQVQTRLHLRNTGHLAENVVATLTIVDDPAVTVVSDTITHETWATGENRNLIGFKLDIDSAATQDIVAQVRLTADGAGPWDFAFTIPVTPPAAPAALAAPADIDGDGAVGLTDILTVAAVYGESASVRPGADLGRPTTRHRRHGFDRGRAD